MDSLQAIVLLMFVAVMLVGVAQKLAIPYPVALVIGGTAIGFIPGLPSVSFNPNLMLVTVLPPILYYSAFSISFQEFKKNWREIFSLALGLVMVTTLIIGVLFKWLFPEFPWALAFAFGAIVSPPDAVAATSILKRFAIGPRLLTILEGESLVNDASALVLYRLAITALLSGVFSFYEASFEFVKVVVGGIGVGAVLGVLIQNFSRRYLEPVVGVVFSFTIPYITYISADALGFSGVLAVVVSGLIGARVLFKHHSSLRRLVGYAAWDIFIILLNCFIFILIGLHLRTFTATMNATQMMMYTAYAFLISATMVLIRVVWIYARSSFSYLKAIKALTNTKHCPRGLEDAALIGWSGMRGIVSLTAALSLPFTFPNGAPLEGREEVIFITFVVILITLIVPGFTLAPLTRWLNIPYYSNHEGVHRVRKQLAKVVNDHLNNLHSSGILNNEEYSFLKTYFNYQRRVYEMGVPEHKNLQHLEVARRSAIEAQRKKLIEMLKKHEIDEKMLSVLEQQLDAEETHLARAELK